MESDCSIDRMKPETTYRSFLVRFWARELPGGSNEAAAWQGEVVLIQSGHKVSFQDMDHLFHYLREQVETQQDNAGE